jgi:hypothetical protein
MDPGFDRYGDAFFSGAGLLDPPPRRGRRRQRMEDEQEADFYAQLMENQQEQDHYRQLQNELLPDIDHRRGLDEPRLPYLEPVQDRFDDSFFPDASGERYLMEPRWRGDQHLFEKAPLSDPGDPMGTRARRRRLELEDEIHPHIGPMDMRVLGPVAGHRFGASYDEHFPQRGGEAELYMRSQDRRPRRRRSLSITSGFRLPPGATSDPHMPRDVRMKGHLMGSPEANMLLGARPLLDRGGTSMPDIGLREPMFRNRR